MTGAPKERGNFAPVWHARSVGADQATNSLSAF